MLELDWSSKCSPSSRPLQQWRMPPCVTVDVLKKLAHVDLVEVEHEADVDRPKPALLQRLSRLLQSFLSMALQLPEEARRLTKRYSGASPEQRVA
eukprot:2884750-Pyramimonas_sp.AAC.1